MGKIAWGIGIIVIVAIIITLIQKFPEETTIGIGIIVLIIIWYWLHDIEV